MISSFVGIGTGSGRRSEFGEFGSVVEGAAGGGLETLIVALSPLPSQPVKKEQRRTLLNHATLVDQCSTFTFSPQVAVIA